MSTTKKIYFLSAIVLIIGCFALNLSYSLFIQTEEKELVNSVVPNLATELSVPYVDLEPNQKVLVKQIVSNLSADISMNYGLIYNSPDLLYDDYLVQLVEIEDNESYGNIGSCEDKYVYLYIENYTSDYATINFDLYKNYDTLNYDNFENNYVYEGYSDKFPDYYSISNDDYYTLTAGTISDLPYDDQPETLAYQSIEAFAKTKTLASDNVEDLFPDYCWLEECVITLTDDMTSGSFEIGAADFSNASVYWDGILESGIHTITDNEGTSYFYRGTNSTNYVDFAGFKWRIMRINGDGSIRLVLDGTLDKVKRSGESSYAGTTSAFNTSSGDHAYAGYMYGLTGLTTYSSTTRCLMLVNGVVTDKRSTYSTQSTCEAAGGVWGTNSENATHANVASSTIKTNLDAFYEKYIGGTTYNYEDYLSTTTSFCTDKSSSYAYLLYMTEDSDGYIMGEYQYYRSIYGTNNQAYYNAHSRLFYGGYSVIPEFANSIWPEYQLIDYYDIFWETYEGYTTPMVGYAPYETWSDHPYPSLTCSGNSNVTKYLTHPIALMTADEVLLAGATQGESVYTYLNTGSSSTFWTMTPYGMDYSTDVKVVTAGGSSTTLSYSSVSSTLGIRPVINLKANIEVAGGSGTYSSPFTVKLPS